MTVYLWLVCLTRFISTCEEVSVCVCVFVFRSANLILNLFSLMLDAGVRDIALEPDKTVQKVE